MHYTMCKANIKLAQCTAVYMHVLYSVSERRYTTCTVVLVLQSSTCTAVYMHVLYSVSERRYTTCTVLLQRVSIKVHQKRSIFSGKAVCQFLKSLQ